MSTLVDPRTNTAAASSTGTAAASSAVSPAVSPADRPAPSERSEQAAGMLDYGCAGPDYFESAAPRAARH